MTNNLQDLLYCLREKPIMADCDQAADLLEKLAALPDEFREEADDGERIAWSEDDVYRYCADKIDQIFTDVLGPTNGAE